MGTAGPAGRVTGSAAPTFRKSLAIVIGIDAYAGDIPPLRSAVNDARRIAKVLATAHKYESVTLFDSAATRQAVVQVLANGPGGLDVGPNDRVCFYFAGHGVAIPGDAGPDGFLLPQDAVRGDRSTYLPMTVVHDALAALPCRHMLVILDSCFAGAFRWSGTRSLGSFPEVIHQERYNRYVQDPAWQAIASAAQDQVALDQLTPVDVLGTRDGDDGPHSPFALALISALEGAGDVVPKDGGDGLITATELYLSVEHQLGAAVIRAGARQTPRFWPLSKHGNGEYVFVTPGRALNLPPAPPLTELANPWRGLKPYERDHSDLFFGRDMESEGLAQALGARALTVVLGASGSGKSSLLKAGALPRLAGDRARWRLLPDVRPGTTPLQSLATAVATLSGAGSPVPATRTAIVEAVSRWCAAHPGTTLLVVVDQSEELVTLTRTPDDRREALQLLGDLLALPGHPVHVVLTLRSDFEPHFDKSVLAPWWKPARWMVAPPGRQALKAIVEGPASRHVLYFDPPALVDALVDDVTNMPGGLPLLSFALSEMYLRYVNEQRADRALTQADYDALGGVIGALRTRADAEHDALDGDHQRTMKWLMLRMVTAGADRLAKRRVPKAELEYDDSRETARTLEVLGTLTDHARLIVQGTDSDGDYAEPAHDAVVRTWGTLVGWVDEVNAEPVPLVTRHKLADAAREWARATRKAQRGLLWSDAVRGALLKPLVTKHAPWLNRQERAFAKRSVRGKRARMAALAVTTAVILALGVVSLSLGLNLLAKRNELEVKTREVDARERDLQEETRLGAIRLLAEDDPTSAAILVRELTRPDDPAAIAAMTSLVNQPLALQVLTAHTRRVTSAVFSPDGNHVLSASDDGTARIWPADGRGVARVLQGDGGPIVSASFSHDGGRVLTAAAHGSVKIWSIAGQLLTTIAGPMRGWSAATFSPDDKYVLAMSSKLGCQTGSTSFSIIAEQCAALVTVEGRLVRWFGGGIATFSRDGRRLVTQPESDGLTGRRPLRVWRLDEKTLEGQSLPYPEPDPPQWSSASEAPEAFRQARSFQEFDAVVFSSDGRSIRAVSESALTSWNEDMSYERVRFGSTNAPFHWRYLDADGKWLAVSYPGNVYLCAIDKWTPSEFGGLLPRRCPTSKDAPWNMPVDGVVRVAAFSTDGSLGAVAARDRAHIVRLGDKRRLVLRGHTGAITSLRFAPDGKRIATASEDGTVRIWPTTPTQREAIVAVAPFHTTGRVEMDVGPDGSRILFASSEQVRVWLPQDAARALTLNRRSGETGFVFAQFAADGSRIMTARWDGSVQWWSPTDLTPLAPPISNPCTVTSGRLAAVSARGSWLAYAGANNTVYVCPAGGGAPVALNGHRATVHTASFSRDGRLIVTASHDRSVRVWEAASGKLLQVFNTPVERFPVATGLMPPLLVTQAVVSPNEAWVATTHGDRSVRLWPLTDGHGGGPVTEPARVWQDVGAIAFSPDSRKVISRRSLPVRIWAIDGGPTVILQPDPSEWNQVDDDATFTPDGIGVVIASRKPELWNLRGARLQGALAAATDVCLDARVRMRFFGNTAEEAGATFHKCERDRGRSPAAP